MRMPPCSADIDDLECSHFRWAVESCTPWPGDRTLPAVEVAGGQGERASEREWAIISVRMQISAIMKGELQAEREAKSCCSGAWNAERSMHAARRLERQPCPSNIPDGN